MSKFGGNYLHGANKEAVKIGFAYVGIVVGADFQPVKKLCNSLHLMVYGHILV